jgi:hypothetical protein
MGRKRKANEGPVLTPAVIEELKRKGHNQADIARMFGVTRAYVSKVKLQVGNYSRTPREIAMDHYPWTVGARFNGASIERRMRDHFEYMATGGRGMSEDKLKRLATFYRRLQEENVVVEFDPALPPCEGANNGGFAYRPKLDSDGELIIRVNCHTNLTDVGKTLLRFPPVLPKV